MTKLYARNGSARAPSSFTSFGSSLDDLQLVPGPPDAEHDKLSRPDRGDLHLREEPAGGTECRRVNLLAAVDTERVGGSGADEGAALPQPTKERRDTERDRLT